ncbi:MAG: GAF domain-containing protein [Antricoccus sp.]
MTPLRDASTETIEHMRTVQGRLRGLIRANELIISGLDLVPVLQHIVEAAAGLVGAQYCALGVLDPAGGLAEFVHTGMDEATVDRIGHRPEGKGLVGALIDEPKTIRLRILGTDPRSVGVPEGHPIMDSFLGVPIRVRDQVLGNLYLANSTNGEFSIEDEELVTSLAATAGFAIENAQLYREAEHRQEWLRASAQIIQEILTDDGGDPLRHVAMRIRKLAGAELVSVVVRIPDSAHLTVAVAVGEGASRLTASSFPAAGSLAARAIADGHPLLVDDIDADPNYWVHLSKVMAVGPVMVLPLLAAGLFKGVLVVGRRQGRPVFTDVDLGLGMMFAGYAAIALEITAARADQQRLLLLEERDRIARDLHDHIVQRIFATGLTLQSIATAEGSGPVADRLYEQIEALDETIRQIRSVIYHLQQPTGGTPTNARARLLDVIEQASVGLPEPWVQFIGPIDIAATGEVVEDLLAVVREMLTNVAKHAHARNVEVTVTVTDDLHQISVTTTDDGCGVSKTGHRGGLKNLQERARRYGGELVVTPAPQGSLDMPTTRSGGTRCHWTANINH